MRSRPPSKAPNAPKKLRVMQSFREPRPTTNPYIVQLDRALAAETSITHLRFSWWAALFGPLDVVHLHWPEVMLEGSTPLKRAVKRLRVRALLLRLRVTRTALVRTTHNIDLPEVDTPTTRLLTTIEERTDFRILLNDSTRPRWSSPTAVILHGHYSSWYSDSTLSSTDNTLAFVGLIRRYKGVERLIDAFRQTGPEGSDLRLRISGNPTGDAIREVIEKSAVQDPRITVDLRFLSDDDFADAVRTAQGIVLPYSFMHNSGTALAAVSLGRPVLLPRNEVNESLAEEVGPGWVHMFDDEIRATDLLAFAHATKHRPPAPPDLERRDWTNVGRAHAGAYVDAARTARHSPD